MIALALLVLLAFLIFAVGVLIHFRETGRGDGSISEGPGAGCGWIILVVFLLILWGACTGPINRQRGASESAMMQTTRTLALAMFQYANDNDEQYPDGKSSTEVFQKLMDGNYISDPGVFYFPSPGKTKAGAGAKLRPENVCFDVTSGVDANSPDSLPVVFVTGFRIDYRANGSAISLIRHFPQYHNSVNAWLPWIYESFDGLAIAYKSNNAYFRSAYVKDHGYLYTPDDHGIVPNIIAPDFNAGGRIYHQLTPEGVLK